MDHFVLIKRSATIYLVIQKRKLQSFLQLCRNCFQIQCNEIDHQTHQRLCRDHEPAVVIMPTAKKMLP